GLLHPFVIDADISEGASDGAGGGTNGGADQRHQEDQADQRSPEGSRNGPGRGGVEELVELDAAARVFHCNDRVAQFEQVLSLHCQQLLADLLRLRLGRKGDHNEFTHGILPWQLQKSIAPRRRRDTDLWCKVTEAERTSSFWGYAP